MTKQDRRINLALAVFAAAVFAGSILNWLAAAILVWIFIILMTITCLIGVWAAMDDDWLRGKSWRHVAKWKYVYDAVMILMLFAGSMTSAGILYFANWVIARYIRYRHNQVNRIVSSK